MRMLDYDVSNYDTVRAMTLLKAMKSDTEQF